MKKAAPTHKGRRGKHLDDDETALWQHTAQSVEPLKRAKSRVHPAQERALDDAADRPRGKGHGPAHTKADATHGHGHGHSHTPAHGKAHKAAAMTPPPPIKPRVAEAPPLATFDRRKVRKIRSGQVEIEARIDLHGMRQDEAHAALRAFLHRCQGKGQRWVLVITGKGKPLSREADHETPFDMAAGPRDRGVLKRNVPRWLDEADLRPMVVSYATAAPNHGGDGALYVHLRTKAR